MLVFNLDNPHLASPLVRQAIAYAVNRPAIIDQALGGYGSLVRSYLPDWHPLAANPNALPGYEFNLEQSRKLLSQAGYDVQQNPVMHRKFGLLTLKTGRRRHGALFAQPDRETDPRTARAGGHPGGRGFLRPRYL